jgi:hypothetical protein
MNEFCCVKMSDAYNRSILHINEINNSRRYSVHMGNIGDVWYCPYCGKKIEMVNDIP